VLTVNLEQGDLTFRTAFPIMATNALGWFAGQAGELRESLASGAVTEVALPAATIGAEILVCRTPGGKALSRPQGVGKGPIGPADECGLWSITRQSSEALSSAKSPAGGTPSVP